MQPIDRRISTNAAALRRSRTEAEDRFWRAVRNRRLGGYKFRFQHSVYPHVADFACLEVKLIVELDGSQHGDDVDAERTAFLEGRGFRVIRFWNNDVMQRLPAVLEALLHACNERVGRSG